ncbi:MAG TPA: glycosyltransferase 87 family protein, partial [Actinomycetota bacterium]|nr:glycosyltransferase 87 family protein [Actinomycetota bacterium]
MPVAVRRIGLGVVLASLAGTLLVGLAVKSPCASGDWGDGRAYTRFCYTDIVPLLGTEQLTGDRIPYLDACEEFDGVCDEYPVLSMYTMRLAAWISGANPGYFYANVFLLTIGAVVIAVCLYIMVGSRALYFTLAPTLAIYAFINWDLVAVALAAAGTLAYLRRRDVWSGVLLGLGAGAKLYPALFVVPFVAGRFRGREPDRGIHLAWAAAGSWLAVNLPFVVGAPGSWWTFFGFNSRRAADWDSLWFIACERLTGQGCVNVRAVTLGSGVFFAGLVALVWWTKRQRDPGFARWTLGFPILVLFLLTSKVYSPQYSLWLLPWFALGLPNLRLFVAFEMADTAVFLSRFSWFARLEGLGGVPIST